MSIGALLQQTDAPRWCICFGSSAPPRQWNHQIRSACAHENV